MSIMNKKLSFEIYEILPLKINKRKMKTNE